MRIHILGICGTFMGSLALLARELGHEVSGSDTNIYPPMSDQLRDAGIDILDGYRAENLAPDIDLVVIGNAMSRGNPEVEAVLNKGLRYTSGPQMLADVVLPGRHVVAVAGTHGKTTTSSMVAWILEAAGLAPGYLIGGVPGNFEHSARLGESSFFVVEADEYDTAFFDKRSKFVHYRPRTAILNNLEFDHADIFDDLAAIQRQFHHLVRTIPGNGRIVLPDDEPALNAVLDKGCWSEVERFGEAGDVRVVLDQADGSAFSLVGNDGERCTVQWDLTGLHNVKNGAAALLAARHCGVSLAQGAEALGRFRGVKRRMELLCDVDGVRVYDDFAHHPTAIATTLDGLRRKVGAERILAVIEPRSNTMRMGAHRDALPGSVEAADDVIWYQPEGIDWALDDVAATSAAPARVMRTLDEIIDYVVTSSAAQGEQGHASASENASGNQGATNVVIMSNGGFGGIHRRLVERLSEHKKGTGR